MKITYAENPLETIVELDAREKELLRLKIKIAQYEEILFDAHWHLTRTAEYLANMSQPMTVEQSREAAVNSLDPKRWCDDDNEIDKQVEKLLQHCLEELKGSHAGDCTAFPAPCLKCHAESLVGINTLEPYPGKHVLHRIYTSFHENLGQDENGEHMFRRRSLSEVLELLRAQEAFDGLAPHLKKQAADAYEWLNAKVQASPPVSRPRYWSYLNKQDY